MLGLGLQLNKSSYIALPILNQVSGSVSAYSLRKLKSGVTNAIKVRRSSDNAEQDIPFCGNDLCITTLTNFVGTQNLLTYSEDLSQQTSTAPASSTAITTDATTAPDNTNTADKVTVDDTLSNGHIRFKTFTGAVNTIYTYSGYFKKAEYDRVQIYLGNTGFANISRGIIVNLNDGSLIFDNSEAYTISNVGNDWYRISCTVTSDADGGAYVAALVPCDNTVDTIPKNFTPAQTGLGIYAWGLQVNVGSTPNAYNKTVVGIGGDGFVTTWYDQSGSGFHATQTTTSSQPQLVSAGSIITVNSRPAITYTGSHQLSITGTFVTRVAFAVAGSTVLPFVNFPEILQATNVPVFYGSNGTNNISSGLPNSGAVSNTRRVNGAIVGTMTPSGSLKVISTVGNSDSPSVSDYKIGRSAYGWNGYIDEIIVYNVAITDAQRSKIEKNQGKYYGITVA